MSYLTKFFLLMLLLFSSATYASSADCRSIWNDILSNGDLDQMYKPLTNLCGEEFRSKLRKIMSTNKDLGYKGARNAFFGEIDNVNGEVCGVYTGKCLSTSGIPNHNIMNCEHSWPQSKGATGIAKSDIHHLYPSDSKMNSRRSNHPLCEVVNSSYEGNNGVALGESKFGTRCFEPPFSHKGDVARSMLYFSLRYDKKLDSQQEGFFRKWHEEDTISEKELLRNDAIQKVQKNRNPFVDYPKFVYLIKDF
ncbi:MAG: endonuclease [Bacteriovoracaceae bacterium]|nr:endonuclease [Bacteriovoracaceae bacterium]